MVLDVGCGIGYLEYYLLKKGFTGIHAIDLSEEQLQAAREKLLKLGLKYENRIKFEAVDTFEYLRKNKGYVVVMLDILDHLRKDKVIELLKLVWDTLFDNGFIIIRVTNADNPLFARFFYRDFTHETPFTPNSIRQCLSIAGFRIVHVDYENIPQLERGHFRILWRFLYFIRISALRFIAKFLGIRSAAFAEDIIVVGKK